MKERKGQKKWEWVVWSPSRLGRSFVEVDGEWLDRKALSRARGTVAAVFSLAPSSVRFVLI